MGEEINADFHKIPRHSFKHGGLGIPDRQVSAESVYNTSKSDSGELIDSLLGGTALNYVSHRACVRGSSMGKRKERKHVELADLARQKELAGGQERYRLHRATVNGAWLSSVPHCLNGTELSREEFRDNIRFRYGLMLQDIPTAFDGCSRRILIEHALS